MRLWRSTCSRTAPPTRVRCKTTFRKVREVQQPIQPRELELDIKHEDDDIVVLNKAPGITVHPGINQQTDETFLINGLVHRYGVDGLSNLQGDWCPGIVHRLDRDTSGLMVVCRNNEAHESLKEQLKQKAMARQYYAIVKGSMKEREGDVTKPILRHHKLHHKMTTSDDPNVGKHARTVWRRDKTFRIKKDEYTAVHLRLDTGRTHQIRVHMCSIGHSIVGDPLYSRKHSRYSNLMLTANMLALYHPTKGNRMEFDIGIPEYMSSFIEAGKSSND